MKLPHLDRVHRPGASAAESGFAPYDHPEISGRYFFPQSRPPLPVEGRVMLPMSDGSTVAGWWSKPLEDAPTLLFFYGNGESIADQLDRWPRWAEKAGANVFFVDYPGYGDSQGRPSFGSCREAARRATDHLLAQPKDEVPSIVIMGRSAGSIFALDAAANVAGSDRLAGLVLESAVADPSQRIEMRLPDHIPGLDRAAALRALSTDFDHRDKLGRLDCPVLIMHTADDSLVPVENANRLAEWAGDKVYRQVTFPFGGHNGIQHTNAQAYQHHLAELIREVS